MAGFTRTLPSIPCVGEYWRVSPVFLYVETGTLIYAVHNQQNAHKTTNGVNNLSPLAFDEDSIDESAVKVHCTTVSLEAFDFGCCDLEWR